MPKKGVETNEIEAAKPLKKSRKVAAKKKVLQKNKSKKTTAVVKEEAPVIDVDNSKTCDNKVDEENSVDGPESSIVAEHEPIIPTMKIELGKFPRPSIKNLKFTPNPKAKAIKRKKAEVQGKREKKKK